MKYKTMLEVCEQNNFYPSQVMIAEELLYQLQDTQELKVDDERYEHLCEEAHYCYLKAEETSIFSICKAIAQLEREFVDGEGDDPLTLDKWAILDKAAYYEAYSI